MRETVEGIVAEGTAVRNAFFKDNLDRIVACADRLAETLASGHKMLIFGNGGSAADAQHLAAEFVNRFRIERPPLAAMALTTDTSILTSIGNDYSFDEIFVKQILAVGRRDDIAWGISTSGNSKNVVQAIRTAKEAGLWTLGMSGRSGRLAEIADLCFCVPSDVTARIQEVHITLGHVLCELVDRIPFPEQFAG